MDDTAVWEYDRGVAVRVTEYEAGAVMVGVTDGEGVRDLKVVRVAV